MASKFTLPKFSMPKSGPKSEPKSGASGFDMKALKSYNWRGLKKLASPHAADDLNKFLEKMPVNVGQTMLIIAAVAWASAAGLGLFVTVQLQQLTELSAKLDDAEALKPIVPTITNEAINAAEVKAFVDSIKDVYRDITIRDNGSTIVLTSTSTANFGQWREAVGHVQNGGSGWRVNVERLCVGRECEREPLAAALTINKVSVKNPNG